MKLEGKRIISNFSTPFRSQLVIFILLIFCSTPFLLIIGVRKYFEHLDGDEIVPAARQSKWDTVKKLLIDGVEPNTENDRGQTALMFAANNGTIEIIQLLLMKGANPNHQDYQSGSTPLDYVSYSQASSEKSKIIKLLQEAMKKNGQ